MDDRIAYWTKGSRLQNFGDALTRYLALRLFEGAPIVPGFRYRLIGSVIDYWIIREDLAVPIAPDEPDKLVVWGGGQRDVWPPPPEMLERMTILALRGPLSRDALGLDVPIGDPGLLVPLVYPRRRHREANAPVLCVPHFNDPIDDDRALAISGADRVLRAAVADNDEAIEAWIDEICAAEFVLAGALHAAIVACAYGVPFAFWDPGRLDIAFKWRDFSASIGVPTCFVADLAAARIVHDQLIAPRLAPPPLTPLLSAAPFAVAPHVVEAARKFDAI